VFRVKYTFSLLTTAQC